MFHTRTHKKGLLASSDLIEQSVPGAFSDHFSGSELINSTVCLRCRYLPLCVRWHPYGSEQTDPSGHQARGWPTAPPQHQGWAEQQGTGWEPLLGRVTQVTTASWDTHTGFRRNTSTTQPHAKAHSLCSSMMGLKLRPAFCPPPSVRTKNCWFSAMLWTLLCPTRKEVIFICIKTHRFYQRLRKEVKDCQELWKSLLAAGSSLAPDSAEEGPNYLNMWAQYYSINYVQRVGHPPNAPARYKKLPNWVCDGKSPHSGLKSKLPNLAFRALHAAAPRIGYSPSLLNNEDAVPRADSRAGSCPTLRNAAASGLYWSLPRTKMF